jgi:predicted DCC family thiol-disulfide oxidoreductase YuxK
VLRHDGHVDRSTFVFDGDCAFCTSCARFIERFIRTPTTVVAWQFADLDRLGLTEAECLDAVQFVGGTRHTAGPVAIADLLRTATGVTGRLLWRPAGWLLGLRPVTALAWPGYRWVARNRHRLPGGTAACKVTPGRPGPARPERPGAAARSGG